MTTRQWARRNKQRRHHRITYTTRPSRVVTMTEGAHYTPHPPYTADEIAAAVNMIFHASDVAAEDALAAAKQMSFAGVGIDADSLPSRKPDVEGFMQAMQAMQARTNERHAALSWIDRAAQAAQEARKEDAK